MSITYVPGIPFLNVFPRETLEHVHQKIFTKNMYATIICHSRKLGKINGLESEYLLHGNKGNSDIILK